MTLYPWHKTRATEDVSGVRWRWRRPIDSDGRTVRPSARRRADYTSDTAIGGDVSRLTPTLLLCIELQRRSPTKNNVITTYLLTYSLPTVYSHYFINAVSADD